MSAPEEPVQLGMRCACCRRNIFSLYTYSVICDSDGETFLAVFCMNCWDVLVGDRIYKRIRLFMTRIRDDTPVSSSRIQVEAPRSSP